jgi:antitoxin MazE
MKTFVRKMGNSQGVLIPKLFLEEIGVATGDAVELKINKKKRLVIAKIAESDDPRAGWEGECRSLAEAGEFGLIRDGAGPSSGRNW